MRPIIYPYKMGSQSAKALAEALGAKRVRPDGRYKPRNGDLIINWGNSHDPLWGDAVTYANTLNWPAMVARASNKLTTFQRLKEAGVPTPEWTTSYDTAKRWVYNGVRIYCRTLLSGHSGDGIIIAEVDPDDVVFSPLYTKDLGKRYEYRVHVFNGAVIDFQKKRRSVDGTKNDDIRSHANGWIFCRDEVSLPELVGSVAVSAVASLGLSFGAVDVAYRARTDAAFVFEVNTAPGLEGKTLKSYVNAIKTLL